MAIQTYIKRGNAYSAGLTFSGADADQISGVYQVFISLIHEWGNPVFNYSLLAAATAIGDTEITVLDGTQFAVGNNIIFHDTNMEGSKISAIDGNVLTITALTKSHRIGTNVSVERAATRTAANNYAYTLSSNDLISSGVHKIRWHYVQSGVSTFTETSINVYQPYADAATFFEFYPELETEFEDFFDHNERVIRDTINTFCGQNFDYYYNKSITLDGSGKNSLHLPLRLVDLGTTVLTPSEDISDMVDVDPLSRYYVRLTGSSDSTVIPSFTGGKWNSDLQYRITGNWGWEYVPEYVTQAAMILIADRFNEDSAYPKHGVIESYMDTHRIRFDSVILGSTGNLEADTLLMDYTLFVIGQI